MKQKERLAQDLRSHMEEGLKSRTIEEVLAALGSPEEVADEFRQSLSLEQASPWQRLGAFLVDVFSIILAIALVTLPFLYLQGTFFMKVYLLAILLPFIIGLVIFYFPLTEGFLGQTLGKYFLGLRVTSNGYKPISTKQAFLRRLPFYFNLIWLDGIFLIFSKTKQRAFDKVADTMVIKEDKARRPLLILTLILFLSLATLVCWNLQGLNLGNKDYVAPAPEVSLTKAALVDLSDLGLQLVDSRQNSPTRIQLFFTDKKDDSKLVMITLEKHDHTDKAEASFNLWKSQPIKIMAYESKNTARYRLPDGYYNGWLQGLWVTSIFIPKPTGFFHKGARIKKKILEHYQDLS